MTSTSRKRRRRRSRRVTRQLGYSTLTASGDDADDGDYVNDDDTSDSRGVGSADESEIEEEEDDRARTRAAVVEYDGEAGDYDSDDVPILARIMQAKIPSTRATSRSARKQRTSAVTTTVAMTEKRRSKPTAVANNSDNGATIAVDATVASTGSDKSQPCYITALPTEILQKILDYVEPETDLTKFEKRELGGYCVVNRAFRDILQPRLFDSIRITPLKSLYQFSNILDRSPAIRLYPRTMRIELQCSLAEESNMVASALHSTVPRCANLRSLEVLLTAPMGFQVIFPLLGRDFHAPSVERLDIRLGTFTSSCMQFVSSFTRLKCVHLNGLDFRPLLIADRDKKFALSSVEKLLISNSIIAQSAIELFTCVFPSIRTISMFISKGSTVDFLTKMQKSCPNLRELNVYRCGNVASTSTTTVAKSHSHNRAAPFRLPAALWSQLSTIRLLFCCSGSASLSPLVFPPVEAESEAAVVEWKLEKLVVVEMFKNWLDAPQLDDIRSALTRMATKFNTPRPPLISATTSSSPSLSTPRPSFDAEIIFRTAMEPHAKTIDDAFDENLFLEKIRSMQNCNVEALRTVHDELKGSKALTIWDRYNDDVHDYSRYVY
ncbi:uncharacterized protein V1518DRAFT_402706 [Limtongia smithiae]|uniref:uncharacterized protein n=1 Tax=Limtongia smithiae TaxID=1125753 RepID=UPI0034CF6676